MNEQVLLVSKLRDVDDVFTDVCSELRAAEKKFPLWPLDPIHGAAIVAEEAGELVKAALQYCYDGGTRKELRTEAIQTAAMAIRFLLFLEVEDEDLCEHQ